MTPCTHDRPSPCHHQLLAALFTCLVACSGGGGATTTAAGGGDAATGSGSGGGPDGQAGGEATGGASSAGSGGGDVAACLADIPCGNSGDCEAGQRCNLAVDEPVCGVIRCGASGDPCSEAELCSDDMACLDPTTFGTETLSAAGRCHTGEEARALCVAKCLEVPQEQGVPCDGSFLSQMCEHACAQYPEGWDAECLEQWPGDLSGFSFDKAACVPDVDHVGCFLDLLCDGHRMTFDVPCE